MQVITTVYDLKQIIPLLEKENIIGYDLETTGLLNTSKILLVVIGTIEIQYVIDFSIIDIKYFKLLEPVLTSTAILKLGANLAFDWRLTFTNTNIQVQNMHDVMLVDQLLSAGLYLESLHGSMFSLAAIVSRRLGITLEKETRKIFIGYEGKGFLHDQYQYAANDIKHLFPIYRQQMEEIHNTKLDKVYQLEMDLIPCTALMEATGFKVDRARLEALIEPFTHYVDTCYKALQDVFISSGAADTIVFTRDGYTCVNPASKPQMLAALRTVGIELENLNAKTVVQYDYKHSKNKEGFAYASLISDDEVADALEKYGGLSNPYLRMYAFLTGAEKLLNTYVLGTLAPFDINKNKGIHPKTGRLIGFYRQLGARATGRYSSNLQQFPKDDKLARLGLPYSYRQCFIPDIGRKLVIADFSGIELVILADRSGDELLAHEITMGDIHLVVCIKTLGKYIPLALQITDQNKKTQPFELIRDGAKIESYGIAYGVTGKSLAEQLTIKYAPLNISLIQKQGDDLINLWKYEAFPKAGKYLDASGLEAIKRGYVTDNYGRRRYWNREHFKDIWKKYAAEREGKNAPIQMTSATMTKLAMVYCYQELPIKKARIIGSTHDELIIESVDSYAEKAAEILTRSMERAGQDTLPMMGKHVKVKAHIRERYDK